MKNITLLGLSGLIMTSAITFADGIVSDNVNSNWRPLVALGGGIAVPRSLGKYTNFPISNPVTDWYYTYTPNGATPTKGLFEAFLAAERRLCDLFIFQGGLAYSYTGSVMVKGSLLQGADPGSDNLYRYQYKIGTQQLLAQAKFMMPYGKKFYPYILGGIGVAFNRVSQFQTTVPPTISYTRIYADNSPNTFAYRVGLGIDVDVATHYRAGIAYRYNGMGPVSLGNATLASSNVLGTLKQSNLNFNEVLAQVSYVM